MRYNLHINQKSLGGSMNMNLEVQSNKPKMNIKKNIIGVIIGLTVLGLAIKCSYIIPAGYNGIVYSLNGGIEGQTLGQGFHIVVPWKKVVEYTVATEQAYLSKDAKEGSPDDDSFLIPTKDGKTVNVDLEFSYHFDASQLPKVFTRFKGQEGKQIEQSFIRGKIKAWSGEVSSKFTVLDIYGEKRSELNNKVYEHVKKNFAQYGIEVDSVNFSRIGLDEQTEKAIQERVNAQQQLEKQKIEKEKALIEAERKKIEAQGLADARLIQAEADAKANEILKRSLSSELVQLEWVKKWDGKMPTVNGSNGGMILDIKNLSK